MSDQMERLESAIEKAEAMQPQSMTVSATLCQIFRQASRGFTDTEAEVWADRLESLMTA